MKTTHPTADQSYMAKNGEGLTNRTNGHTESQSAFKTTHRRASFVIYYTGPLTDSNPFFRLRFPYKHHVLLL